MAKRQLIENSNLISRLFQSLKRKAEKSRKYILSLSPLTRRTREKSRKGVCMGGGMVEGGMGGVRWALVGGEDRVD